MISKPPVDPPQLNTRPIPAPAITPPNNEERSGSVATIFTGIQYSAADNTMTETIVLKITFFQVLCTLK